MFQLGWQEIVELGGLVGSLLANEHKDDVVDHVGGYPCGYHDDEPLLKGKTKSDGSEEGRMKSEESACWEGPAWDGSEEGRVKNRLVGRVLFGMEVKREMLTFIRIFY